jgi:hypothetical protein
VSILRYDFRIINNKDFNLSEIIGVSASARDRFGIPDNSWTGPQEEHVRLQSRSCPALDVQEDKIGCELQNIFNRFHAIARLTYYLYIGMPF